MIVAAFPWRFDQFGPENEILVPTTAINIVVLEKRRRRVPYIGGVRCLRHELLVYTAEEILASDSLLALVLVGRNRDRIGVLDDQRLNGGAALQRFAFAGQDRSDPRLVEHADRAIANVESLYQGFVELEYIRADMKSATAFVLPGARHRRNAARRVHVSRAVARA